MNKYRAIIWGGLFSALIFSFIFFMLCYSLLAISEPDKPKYKNIGRSYSVIDLSHQEKWPVQKWKIRDRDLTLKAKNTI